MSRLVIPISYKVLWATGDVKLWTHIYLHMRDGGGNWRPQRFRVNSGTEITTYPAFDAAQLGLVVPTKPAPVRHRQSGLEVRSGMLRFRIDGMDPTEYAASCLFLGDPNAAASSRPPKLLQPLALLERLRFTMEKDPTGQNQYGQLVVEKV